MIITAPVCIHCRRLVLEDGSVWHGTAFGYTGVEGEYFFNNVFEKYVFKYDVAHLDPYKLCSGRMRVQHIHDRVPRDFDGSQLQGAVCGVYVSTYR